MWAWVVKHLLSPMAKSIFIPWVLNKLVGFYHWAMAELDKRKQKKIAEENLKDYKESLKSGDTDARKKAARDMLNGTRTDKL